MRLRGLLAALIVVMCAGCRPSSQQLARVTWQLSWDLQRLQRHDGRLVWTTDRGYDIALEAGLLVTWRLGLEPCGEQAAWSLLPEAHAHHLEPPDPTSVLPHLQEDLLQARTVRLPPRDVPQRRYCRALWLASAPPQAQAGGLPRQTLMLRGRWHKHGRQGPLAVSTWIPDARLGPAPLLAAAPPDAVITIERHLAASLDGIDLADAPTEALSWHVLHRLTSQATVTVEPRHANAKLPSQPQAVAR